MAFNKILKRIVLILSVLSFFIPGVAFAIPSSVDRITDHIEPLIKTDYIKGAYFIGTTTTASVFPFASTTALSATSLCLSTDCRTAWPSALVYTGTFPIKVTGTAISFVGLSTSTAAVVGNIPYFTGANTFGNVATSTLTASSPLTGSFVQIGSGGSLGCQTASGSQAGCLSSADWTTFNNKTSNTGTVTSVAASVPAFLSVGGSPITTAGTLAISYSGTALPVANGGTNATSFTTSNSVVGYNGTSLITAPLTSALAFPYASTTALTATTASTTNLNITGLGNTGNSVLYATNQGVVSPTSTLAWNVGGTGNIGGPWSTYAPVATCSAGTITSYISSGHYEQIGHTVFVAVNINITSVGSCTGDLISTLPTNPNTSLIYTGLGYNANTASFIPVVTQSGSFHFVPGSGGTSGNFFTSFVYESN